MLSKVSRFLFVYGRNRSIHAVHGVNGASADVLSADSCEFTGYLRNPKSHRNAPPAYPVRCPAWVFLVGRFEWLFAGECCGQAFFNAYG